MLVLTLARELLERPDVTLDDDFFTVGGDSISAMHLVGRISRQTGLRLRVSWVYATPVLRDLAAAVEQARANGRVGHAS
ncbi:phosphopantetheine-binding protein [Streptomyces sp. G45]|uniref:phosphopantetheine-binding protein n=1 Tax=Streptomyces sp. G45 TaxID=3406627 RepID=UPI003C2A80DD